MLRIVTPLLLSLLTAGGTMFALVQGTVQPHPTNKTSLSTFVLQEIPADVVSTSFIARRPYAVDPRARILLVPHHLVAGREIASLVSSTPAPKRVLLLSPDHFSQGQRALSTTRRSFVWNNVSIPPANALVDTLLAALPKALQIQDGVFRREHGVRGLVPFFQEAWPGVQVSALTVRTDTSSSTVEQLAQTLHTALQTDPGLLIVITIDFSHELPAYLADLHDRYAIQELLARNTNASSLVEIDSPPLFRLLTRLAQLQGLTLQLHAHTNSLRLMHASVTERGTSHVLMSGAPRPSPDRSSPTTSPATISRFTLFHDSKRPIVSSENRAYRGYSDVRETTIPFPATFVREITATTTHWHTLPLRNIGSDSQAWELVSDQHLQPLSTQRAQWATWARNHLSDPSNE